MSKFTLRYTRLYITDALSVTSSFCNYLHSLFMSSLKNFVNEKVSKDREWKMNFTALDFLQIKSSSRSMWFSAWFTFMIISNMPTSYLNIQMWIDYIWTRNSDNCSNFRNRVIHKVSVCICIYFFSSTRSEMCARSGRWLAINWRVCKSLTASNEEMCLAKRRRKWEF